MALTVNTNIINDTDQYLLDAKNVKGSYVVVTSADERDTLPAATTVKGSLCYVTGTAAAPVNKFYQYNGTNWVEKEFGTTTEATTSAAGLMSSADKTKLAGIASGAEVNVQADWNETNTSSDAYIKNKPTALKNPNALSIGGKSYDGSSAVSVTDDDLGITPLTDEEVDAIWDNAISTSEASTLNQLLDEKLSGINFSGEKPQKIRFAYYNEDMLVANSKHPIQANGNYMCYCNNAKLKLCKADGTVVKEGAKQLSMMTAHGAKTPYSANFKACGQAWTGDTDISNIIGGKIPIDGFRVTLNEGAYITADEDFAVCEMICDKKTTKVLFIGNSHSQDTFMPFSEVFCAEGQVDYVFGLCKKEGSSVQDHSNNIQNKTADYAYYESTPTSQESYTNPFGKDDVDGGLVRVTMDRILKQHEWDYVFIQLSPFDLTDDTVFATDRKVIVNRIKDLQPNAKIGYACPWLAPYDDDITKMDTLDGPRKTWYEAMVAKGGTTAAGQYSMFCNAIKNNILNDKSCSMISAAGSSVYYANQILKVSSNVLYRDVLHLSKGLGRLLAAYTFYAQLMQASGKLDALNGVKLVEYVLGSYSLTQEDKNMILESVNYILQNPWVVPAKE